MNKSVFIVHRPGNLSDRCTFAGVDTPEGPCPCVFVPFTNVRCSRDGPREARALLQFGKDPYPNLHPTQLKRTGWWIPDKGRKGWWAELTMDPAEQVVHGRPILDPLPPFKCCVDV